MEMIIYISSIDELQQSIESFNPDHVISTVASSSSFDQLNKILADNVYTKGKLQMSFNDLDVDDIEYLNSKGEGDMFNYPSMEHIKMMKEYIDDHYNEGDKILFHCVAGVSRSTAMAFGVLVYLGHSALNSFKYVSYVRPFHYMNNQILKLWDESGYLDTDVKLFDINEKWNNYLFDSGGLSTRDLVYEKLKTFTI